jgi:hypothetical protein
MFCSLWTDPIVVKVKSGECLCETKTNERFGAKIGILHCFVLEQWQDVVLLVDRSHWTQSSVSRVSMRNEKK